MITQSVTDTPHNLSTEAGLLAYIEAELFAAVERGVGELASAASMKDFALVLATRSPAAKQAFAAPKLLPVGGAVRKEHLKQAVRQEAIEHSADGVIFVDRQRVKHDGFSRDEVVITLEHRRFGTRAWSAQLVRSPGQVLKLAKFEPLAKPTAQRLMPQYHLN